MLAAKECDLFKICFLVHIVYIIFYYRQRWVNTVFWTEYEYEQYSESEFWPNTKTNNIRFLRMSEYEYE